MKSLSVFFTSLLVVFLVSSLYAQTVSTYDNFNGKEIPQGYVNPSKWFGIDSSSLNGVIVLEDIRALKTYVLPDGVNTWMGLNMALRAYGDDIADPARKSVWKSVWMPDGGDVTTMIASIQINKFGTTGCAATSTRSEAKIRIGGAFFNTDASTPGDQTNDVYAYVGIGTSSDDPTKLLARGSAFKCNDANCTTTVAIGSNQDLGLVKKSKRYVIRVTYDTTGHKFVFQLGNLPEKSIDLTEYPNTSAPGTNWGGGKRIQVRLEPANCESPRTVAGLNASVDHVWIGRTP